MFAVRTNDLNGALEGAVDVDGKQYLEVKERKKHAVNSYWQVPSSQNSHAPRYLSAFVTTKYICVWDYTEKLGATGDSLRGSTSLWCWKTMVSRFRSTGYWSVQLVSYPLAPRYMIR